MTQIEFQEKFGTEEKCREYLFKKRWPEGFICPKCGHREYYNVQSRHLYQCKSCNYQASLTTGTVMEKTRTPLAKWFLALYLMSEDKRGCSALSLQAKLGVAYYTAWCIAQKIRYAMSNQNAQYLLSGIVEMDESFFGGTREGGKRGRGTEKTAVMVSVSLTEQGKPCHARMKVVKSVDSDTVKEFSKSSIKVGSEVRTDGLAVYNCLADEGYRLVQKNYDRKKQPEHLHWTHIIISNAKAFIEGTFHGLDSVHLQDYLNEFCYRFNRRFRGFDMISHISGACIFAGKITAHELIG